MHMKEKKYLIIPRPHIGDFIWVTSAVSILKKYDSTFKITVLIPEYLNELVENNYIFDDKINYNFKYFKTSNICLKILYRIALFIKLVFIIRMYNFDCCFLFSPFSIFTKIVAFSGIDRIIFGTNECCGIKKESVESKFLNKFVSKNKLFPIRTYDNSDFIHYSEKWQTIVRGYFNSFNMALPVLPENKKKSNITEEIVKKIENTKVALCINGSKDSKNVWPEKYFKQTIEDIAKNIKVSFFIVGGREQYESSRDFILNFNNTNIDIRNLCGETSLLELKEIFEHIDLLISVDTGVVHIAATTKINIITLFGMTAPEAVMPMTPNNISLYTSEKCSPCVYSQTFEKKKCPYDKPKCMNNINPEIVVKTALNILD